MARTQVPDGMLLSHITLPSPVCVTHIQEVSETTQGDQRLAGDFDLDKHPQKTKRIFPNPEPNASDNSLFQRMVEEMQNAEPQWRHTPNSQRNSQLLKRWKSQVKVNQAPSCVGDSG